MKRAKITYREVTKNGEKYVIVDSIENVATLKKLEKEFGSKALNNYLNIYPHYYKKSNGIIKIYFIKNGPRCFQIEPTKEDKLISKKLFFEYIKLMKKAGDHLQKIKELYQKPKVIYI